MPVNSLHVNNKAVAQNTFDAIVVGFGISGGWSAKELTEKELKVLMLERGPNLEHIKNYKTANIHTWDSMEYFIDEGVHEMSTVRMGRDPKSSVLNKWNRVWDGQNVL